MIKKFTFRIALLFIIASNSIQAQTATDSLTISNGIRIKKPKNIILMIGDGMGLTQMSAGGIAKRDALEVERCRVIGLIKTSSSDDLITDSAAGATAFSTGVKTFNGAIGLGPDSFPRKTIVEYAEEKGLATGLVAVCSITHATPASFFAHQNSRLKDEEIAADFLKTDVDVFIAGGRQFFEQRKDKRNLVAELQKKNYQVVDGMDNIKDVKNGKLAGFIAKEHPDRAKDRGPVLGEASVKAITLLNPNEKGFFLMIEGSQIDWGGHANNSGYIVEEVVDFDKTIGNILDFAAKDGETLVIITADHETGGYAITGGNLSEGKVNGSFTTLMHTAAMVPVYAFGPGSEMFMGIYENTAIFDKMMRLYGFVK